MSIDSHCLGVAAPSLIYITGERLPLKVVSAENQFLVSLAGVFIKDFREVLVTFESHYKKDIRWMLVIFTNRMVGKNSWRMS
jgi:hypothetical protein